jgi:hypothetical protein
VKGLYQSKYTCREIYLLNSRLQQETKQILEEFQAYNSDIAFEFVDPLEDEEHSEENIKSLYMKD